MNQRLPGACNRSPGSKLLSITTQLHCGGHLGGRVRLPDTILEKDHIFHQSLVLIELLVPDKMFLCEFPIGSYVKLSTAVQPSWSQGRTAGHIFGREPSNDYFIKVWF